MAYKLSFEIEELTIDRIENTLELILKEISKGNKSGFNRFSDVAEENIKELCCVEIEYNIIEIGNSIIYKKRLSCFFLFDYGLIFLLHLYEYSQI